MFEKSRHCVVLSVFTGGMGTVPLPTRGTDAVPPKGVGFLQARLPMEPLSKAFILLCEKKPTPLSSLRFPLRAGGTLPARFPSRSGGNLQEGGNS